MQKGQHVGPFEIEKELGSGAMGSVYRAILRQEGKPDRRVALKVIAFGLSSNESALARFEREANILKQLKHPNIVRFLAVGRYQKTPFFAMEYVEGDSLDKIMIERQMGMPTRAPFTWEEVIEMGKPLCAALQHAHDKGIIHRDLKPSNLMLSKEGLLKLTDFGIAKDVDVTAITGANNTIGTAAYMSPEQCKGEKYLTGKSDIYSLGVVFFELLTGRKPFVAESSVDMFVAHVQGTFPRPAQLNPDIPVWLDTLICQMMEKKPEHRPRDAAMVGQVLEEIAEKVASQVSAGADLASARVVDRNKVGGADDRAAARAIRAGSRKKKLKKKRQPIYTKNWFVALACLLVIATIGGVIWKFAFAAPSAESLLQRFEATQDSEAKQAAAERYLKHYGERDDEATRKVRATDRDLRVAKREGQMLKRYSVPNLRANPEADYDADAYQKTMAALAAESEGDVAGARMTWMSLAEKYSKDAAPDKAMWGWHAEKKLSDLNAREAQLTGLLRQLDAMRLDEKEIRFQDQFDQGVIDSLRLKGLGDLSLARDRWNTMAESLKGDAAKRSLFVLARGKVHQLDGEIKNQKLPERPQIVAAKLAEAKNLIAMSVQARKTEGRNLLRDIRDLYAGDTTGEIVRLVQEAKKLLGDA